MGQEQGASGVDLVEPWKCGAIPRPLRRVVCAACSVARAGERIASGDIVDSVRALTPITSTETG